LSFSGLVLESIFIVFLSSSSRETAKNAIKQIEGKKTTIKKKSHFFCKKFLTWTSLRKVVFGVFELPSLRNAPKTPFEKRCQK
jgi:hypothetical protein